MGSSAARHPRRLAPAFRAPTTSVVILDGSVQRVAGTDYNRVVLAFSLNGAGTLDLSLLSAPTAGTGLRIDQANNPFILSYAIHGSLCQEAWYANAGMIGAPLTVVELALQDEDFIGRL